MAYCTTADVVLESGTAIDTETIAALIAKADLRIDATLTEASLAGIEGDSDLEIASVHYTIVKTIDLRRLTNERTNSVSLGSDLSIGNSTQNEIDYHERVAAEAIGRYIARNRVRGVRVRKVNG